MSNSINLVEKQTQKSNKTELTDKIKKISFASILSLGLLSIVLFLLGYRFSIGYVTTQEDKLIRKMSSYEQVGSRAFLLNSRLSDISFLLSSRTKFNDVSDAIIGVTPQNLVITKYDIDSGGIHILAITPNLSDVNDFLNSLIDLTGSKKISVVAIKSLSASQLGYSIELNLN